MFYKLSETESINLDTVSLIKKSQSNFISIESGKYVRKYELEFYTNNGHHHNRTFSSESERDLEFEKLIRNV